MPKKLPIISTLIGISISTLGGIVPTFAETGTSYYGVTEIAPIHAEYARSMEACGPYNRYDSNYTNCYDAVTDSYRERYGGAFESLYQLDYNGRMVVSAINPAAGTLRLYIDETKAYRDSAFTFDNLVVFWADNNATPSPYWDDDVAWTAADAILNGEETPAGYHLLYSGKRGEPGWITPNVENKVGYDVTGDFMQDSTAYFFFLLGYDTAGNRHIEKNYYYNCTGGDFSGSNECKRLYSYNGTSVSYDYVSAATTAEDSAIIELKKATRAAEEALLRAEAAESAAREAEAIAREAEINAREVEAIAREAEASAREAEANAREAEYIAREAENIANEATLNAAAAETAARTAESNALSAEEIAREAEIAARAAESRANELTASAAAAEAAATAAESAAREAEANAKSAEATASALANEANENLRISQELAEEASQNFQSSQALAEKVNNLSSDFTSRLNDLNAKIAALSEKIASESVKPTIVTRTVEAPIAATTIAADTKTIDSTASTASTEGISTGDLAGTIEEGAPENTVEVPLASGSEQNSFPWWIVVFVFSGIALTLWWFIPTRKNQEN